MDSESEVFPMGASKTDTGILIRRYQPGDEAGIAELFPRCFGKPFNAESWRWKYTSNPYSNHNIMVAVLDGKIIAHYAGYCVLVGDGKNRPVQAFQLGDIMTDPGVRGMGIGSRSVIAQLAHAFYRDFCHGNVAFNYGAPAERHLRLGRLFLNYATIGPILQWKLSRSYSTKRLFSKSYRRLPINFFRLSIQQVNPSAGYIVYEQSRHMLGLSVWRNENYLHWRYILNPERKYHSYLIRRGKRPVLWVVASVSPTVIMIVDLLVAEARPTVLRVLLDFLEQQWPGKDVCLWSSFQPSWWNHLLGDVGFRPEAHPFNIHTAFTFFDRRRFSVAGMAKNWFYGMGDYDLV